MRGWSPDTIISQDIEALHLEVGHLDNMSTNTSQSCCAHEKGALHAHPAHVGYPVAVATIACSSRLSQYPAGYITGVLARILL